MSCPSGVPRCRLVPLGKSTSSDAFLHQLGGQKSQSMQESGVCGLPAGGSLYLVTRNTSRGYCGGQARHVSGPIRARSSGSDVFASQCRSQAWWELVRARGVQDILTRSRDHVGCVGRGRAGVRGTRFGSCAPPSQKLLAASLSCIGASSASFDSARVLRPRDRVRLSPIRLPLGFEASCVDPA
jgi:hypothetical protein